MHDLNRAPQVGEQLLALLRAAHFLANAANEEDLIVSILNDAVAALDAQRGSIALAESPNGPLRLRALASGRTSIRSNPPFCARLAPRALMRGESMMCRNVAIDPALAQDTDVAAGSMASVLCIPLRPPDLI